MKTVGRSAATTKKQLDLKRVLSIWARVYSSPIISRHLGRGFVVDACAGDGAEDFTTGAPASPRIIADICEPAGMPFALIEKRRDAARALQLRFERRATLIENALWEDSIDDILLLMQEASGGKGGLIYLDPNGEFDAMRLCGVLNDPRFAKVDCLINVTAAGCKRAAQRFDRPNRIRDFLNSVKRKTRVIRDFTPECKCWQWVMIFVSDWEPKSRFDKDWFGVDSEQGAELVVKATEIGMGQTPPRIKLVSEQNLTNLELPLT